MSFLNQFSHYKINEPGEKEKEWRTIKAYKGMSKDMVCRDMQYEVGQTYTMPDEDVKMCSSGYHACAVLADVAIYLLGLSEILGINLENEIQKKVYKNLDTTNNFCNFVLSKV